MRAEAILLPLLVFLLLPAASVGLTVGGCEVTGRLEGDTPVFTVRRGDYVYETAGQIYNSTHARVYVQGYGYVYFPVLSVVYMGNVTRILDSDGAAVRFSRADEYSVTFTVEAKRSSYRLYIYSEMGRPQAISWNGYMYADWRWVQGNVAVVMHPHSSSDAVLTLHYVYAPPSYVVPVPAVGEEVEIATAESFVNITGFYMFWNTFTFGSFLFTMPYLVLASVYLKTRSVSLAILAGIVVSAVTGLANIAIFVALGLAWLIYRAVWRGSE